MEATCEICHKRPPTEGFLLCDRCKGFDPLSDSKEIPAAERTPELCETCGAPIEPYKIGKNTRTAGECRECYYKRRYGPDWKPGGRTKEEKAAKRRAWRDAKKKANGGNGGSETLQPLPSERDTEQCHTVIQYDNLPEMPPQQQLKAVTEANIKTLAIAFADDDEAMYERLKNIATKERRSMEQQVLYFLDRVIEI